MTPDIFKKDFDSWIIKKKDCHYAIKTPPLFKERDIWWVSVGANVGFEEDGKNGNFVRPVLIVKKFNRELFLGAPMSTKLKDNKYYILVTVKGNTVSVMTSQIRVFSSKGSFLFCPSHLTVGRSWLNANLYDLI